jgi:protein ImuA
MINLSKTSIFKNLQTDILRLQGFKTIGNSTLDLGLGSITQSFPNGCFPLGAMHEFLSIRAEDVASTSGFISGLLSSLMGNNGAALWISASRTLFPPALKNFGLSPDRFIFIDLKKEKDVIWAMDEALKCSALAAVIGEVREMDFTTSRRFQLAVEQSQVTGFILRSNYRKLNTTACVSRWKITSLSSESYNDVPGISFPKWRVELLKIRNGKPGVWDLQWIDGRFVPVYNSPAIIPLEQKKAG